MAKSTTAEVYQVIRDEIISGVIRSDHIILELAVAERFGISKLSAREALQRLCNEKFLKNFPRKGYLVTDISASQMKKLQQVRYQIESFAIRLVTQNCDCKEILKLHDILSESAEGHDPLETINNRFHLQIARLAGNEYICDALAPFLGYATRYAKTAVFAKHFSAYRFYHDDIVKSMLCRDANAALEALRIDLMLDEKDI
jgi:DNA-binding GntR family transcriptional regulator